MILRSAEIRNEMDDEVLLRTVSSMMLDLPDSEWDLMTFDGAWARERNEHRRPLAPGVVYVDSKLGFSSCEHNSLVFLLRPDADDMRKVADFASCCADLLGRTVDVTSLPRLNVKGNRPYKQGGASTFSPVGDKDACSRCMTCVSQCPMEAIPAGSPWTTDGDRCIACGRCVVVCPERSRAFGGDAYRGFEAKFVSAFSARREPETFFPVLG